MNNTAMRFYKYDQRYPDKVVLIKTGELKNKPVRSKYIKKENK